MLQSFSNRELALLICVGIILLLLFIFKSTRESLFDVAKAFFAKKILTVFSLMALYIGSIVWFLSFLGLYDKSVFNILMLWIFGIAIIKFFNINKAQNIGYFRHIAIKSFALTAFIEFMDNFFTFSLTIELIALPLIVFLVMLQVVAEMQEKTKPVAKVINNITSLAAIAMFIFAIVQLVRNYQVFLTAHSLKSFILPIDLTLLFLPFIYLTALYMNYETLFIRIDFMINDVQLKAAFKKHVLLKANCNLKKLKDIANNLKKADLYNLETLKHDKL